MTATDATLARLTRLHPKLIDLSLGRIERLLARLGNPHERLPPVVHVAGTNGKGSTVAFLRATLEAAGLRVHVYTSPHLVRFNERIRVAGRLIDDPALQAALEECEAANGEEPITFFEITTAAAFLAFARTPADVALLEVGLGGRLDATNVVARPVMTAITPVSMDHMHYLGNSLPEIAGEKAGILKSGIPAVIAPQPAAAAAVIGDRAFAVGAPLYRAGHEWTVTAADAGLRYEGERWRLDLPRPALRGEHQIVNAGTAIACLERLSGFAVTEADMRRGMIGVEWPARLHRLVAGPFVAALPLGWELWLDGGHNPDAGEALAAFAQGWRDRPLHLVVGMLDTKDNAGFLRALAPFAASARTVAIPGAAAAMTAEALADVARGVGLKAAAGTGPAEAVAAIVAGDPTPARILICGSLYLAGAVLAAND